MLPSLCFGSFRDRQRNAKCSHGRNEIIMKEREREGEGERARMREREGDLITQISLPVCVTRSNYLVHSLAVREVRFSRSIHR